MIRSLSWILAGAIAVSGCAGPIQTRGQTQQLTAATETKKFRIAPAEPLDNRELVLGRELVAASLRQRGYQSAPDASILVHVALSDRPAAIAIDAGGKNEARRIVEAKRQKQFQSCKDREHRLTVSLFDQAEGKLLYSGSGAEYHCKGTIAQSLPFLIDTALAGLDRKPAQLPQNIVRTRQGVE